MPARISPPPSPIVLMEDRIETSIRIREFPSSEDITSLDGASFVNYMNEIGWSQDGTFVTLLSTMGYRFRESNGRVDLLKWHEFQVASVLSLLISELLPFDLPSINPLPQLPTEIWELIIDRLGPKSGNDFETRTLYVCTLVCRSWYIRARLHLYRKFSIMGDHIPKLQTTLRNNSSLSLSSTKVIRVKCGTKPVSALFLKPTLQNLTLLCLSTLSLTKEHLLITRGPLARLVTQLRLWELQPCLVSNLLRFLNSFQSLTDLGVSFACDCLSHTGQIMPRPHPIPGRLLKTLLLEVVPGVGKLIEWYIREEHFLASLKKLRLSWNFSSSADGMHFEVPASLLRQCMDTLEDLTCDMLFGVNKDPFLNEFSNNVVLSLLLNLRRIEWDCGGGSSTIFQIAATQFCSLRTPCKLVEIILNFYNVDVEGEEIKDHCKAIDEALSSDNFPSLRSVRLFREIPFDYFPTLQSRKLLRVYRS